MIPHVEVWGKMAAVKLSETQKFCGKTTDEFWPIFVCN